MTGQPPTGHRMAGRTSGATGIATFCACGRAFWGEQVGIADDRWQAHCAEEATAEPAETVVLNLRPGGTLVLRYDRWLTDQEYDEISSRFQAQHGPDVKVVLLEGGMRLEGVVSGLFPGRPSESVWLGELSGWTVEGDTVQHRCGFERELTGADAYLANVVVDVVRPHVCGEDPS